MTNETIIRKAYMSAIGVIKDLNAKEVSDLVGNIGTPLAQTHEASSVGHSLMIEVRDAAVELLDYSTDGGTKETDERTIERHREEWNDHVTPVMTEDIWNVFVELDLYSSEYADQLVGVTTDNAQFVIHCVVSDVLAQLLELVMTEYSSVLENDDDDV